MNNNYEYTYYDVNGAVVGSIVLNQYKTFKGFMKHGALKFKNAACGWSSDKAVKVGYKPFTYEQNKQDFEQSYL